MGLYLADFLAFGAEASLRRVIVVPDAAMLMPLKGDEVGPGPWCERFEPKRSLTFVVPRRYLGESLIRSVFDSNEADLFMRTSACAEDGIWSSLEKIPPRIAKHTGLICRRLVPQNPLTVTGTELLVVVPLPSSPYVLLPQH